MTFIKLTAACLAIIFSASCASTYKAIMPQAIHYSNTTSHDEIDLAYKYDVLSLRGNKKYAKREDKHGVRVVAVKVTNNSEQPINLSNDYQIYAGENPMILLDPETAKNLLKQPVPIYLLYLLLSFTNLYVDGSVIPIGLILGPGISIGNMAVAGSANQNLERELQQYNMIDRDVASHETVYGILATRSTDFVPLSLRPKENKVPQQPAEQFLDKGR
jgi:hypothetical protein